MKSPLQIDPAVAAVVASVGLSMEDMTAEYAKEGKLSDASMSQLAKAGITKEVVDTFILGQDAIVAQV